MDNGWGYPYFRKPSFDYQHMWIFVHPDDGSLWCPLEVGPLTTIGEHGGEKIEAPNIYWTSTKVSSQWRIPTLGGEPSDISTFQGFFATVIPEGWEIPSECSIFAGELPYFVESCWIRRLVPEINWFLKHWQIAAMFLLLSYCHTKSRFLCSFHASQTTWQHAPTCSAGHNAIFFGLVHQNPISHAHFHHVKGEIATWSHVFFASRAILRYLWVVGLPDIFSVVFLNKTTILQSVDAHDNLIVLVSIKISIKQLVYPGWFPFFLRTIGLTPFLLLGTEIRLINLTNQPHINPFSSILNQSYRNLMYSSHIKINISENAKIKVSRINPINPTSILFKKKILKSHVFITQSHA